MGIVEVTGGVDTHADFHVAAAVDANGGLLGVASFHDTWARTQDALIQELAATTLAEIAAIDAAIEAGSHHPETPPHSRPTERHGNRN
jgi:hypothetical protein